MKFGGAGFGEAEEVTGVDGHGTEEDELEAEGPDDVDADGDCALEPPGEFRHGLPEAGDEDEYGYGGEGVGTAGLGEFAFLLEPLSGHDAVLEAEEGEESQVNEGGLVHSSFSGLKTTTESGGRVNDRLNGWPCDLTGSALRQPKLPMLPPPY